MRWRIASSSMMAPVSERSVRATCLWTQWASRRLAPIGLGAPRFLSRLVGCPEFAPPGSADDHVDLAVGAVADSFPHHLVELAVFATVFVGAVVVEVDGFGAGLEFGQRLHLGIPPCSGM